MILRSGAITESISNGEIVIEPFNQYQLNPNSYDLCLGDNIIVDGVKKAIPDGGYQLYQGDFILAETLEHTESHNHVPMIEGKSSTGRKGLFVHVSAGFGDIGFCGKWTLELYAVKPIVIRKGMRIAQIFWHDTKGDGPKYNGKYQNAQGVESAK